MASKAVKIGLKDESLEVLLTWSGFDGDDCFEDFRITATAQGSGARIYEFGPCAVRAARKMKLFLSDSTQQSVGGGFRHPDVRTYDWHRIGSDLRLVVKFEGDGFEAEHILKSPVVITEEEPHSYAPDA